MIVTNKHNLPEPYFKRCQNDNYPRHPWDTFSVTELMKGTKEIVLNRKHYETLEVDCSTLIWSVFGTAVHDIMEGHAGDDELAEQRVWVELDCGEYGMNKVSGGFDLYNATDKVLTDYKTTGVFSYQMNIKEGLDSNWAKQLRTYWWILQAYGFEVNKVRNTVFLKDWSKTQARRDPSYPQTPIVDINWDMRPMSEEESNSIRQRLTDKIKEVLSYKDSEDDLIPHCTAEERWERDECWAVMREGRKTALKRLYTPEEADTMVAGLPKGHYVEHRPGVPVKCLDYCTANTKCSFFKNYMASLEAKEE